MATACLRERNYNLLDSALAYLEQLEATLTSTYPPEEWHHPPSIPPTVGWNENHHNNPVPVAVPSYPETSPYKTTSNSSTSHLYQNSYATFAESETESDDDDEDDEAGDIVNPNFAASASPYTTHHHHQMEIRRLLIRIRTNQSEVYAAKAHTLRLTKEWNLGAGQYTISLQRIHAALMLADSEISKWTMQQQQQQQQQFERHSASTLHSSLQQDADICEVAITSLSQHRDQYQLAAQQREAHLLRQLQPAWETRDQAKARMGEERWKHNRSPKHDFAQLRRDAERELRNIRQALRVLEDTGYPSGAANDSGVAESVARWSAAAAPAVSSKQRYNGLRPVDTTRRVSLVDYPDPTEYGWTFTGSWQVTEFFEKDQVLLDLVLYDGHRQDEFGSSQSGQDAAICRPGRPGDVSRHSRTSSGSYRRSVPHP